MKDDNASSPRDISVPVFKGSQDRRISTERNDFLSVQPLSSSSFPTENLNNDFTWKKYAVWTTERYEQPILHFGGKVLLIEL